jgi:hypothetical protein
LLIFDGDAEAGGVGFQSTDQKSTILLRLNRGLIDQHDGNVVFHRIDAVALLALQALRVLPVFERLLTGWTNQNFQELFGKHNFDIVRQGM